MARPKGTFKKIPDNEIAKNLCLMGATDEELATAFGIAVSTLYEWKKKKPGFAEALKQGKAHADSLVARALFEKACGYTTKETKVHFDSSNGKGRARTRTKQVNKEYPPDTAAAIIWLKNRQPDRWRTNPEETPASDKVADQLSTIIEGLPS